jgi:hypothetical protein
MAQATAHHACAEDDDLKYPHPPNIGGGGWHVVGLGFGGLVACVPR